MFRIFPDQIERYTKAAQQLVDELSTEELVYFMVLKVKAENLVPPQNSSQAFRTILSQFNNHPIEKKEEGTTTFADLLWDAVIKKSAEIKLAKEPTSKKMVTKRGAAPLPPHIFNIVPDDVNKHVLSLSQTGSVLNVTRTCKYAYRLFRSTNTAKQALSEFNTVLGDAAVGRWNKVFAALTIYPDLVLCTGSTTYCGRYQYEGLTIYQVGLKNYENGDSYHSKMFELFEQCKNGKAEMAKQYFEIFPNGKMFSQKWDIDEAKKRLDKFIVVLTNNKKPSKDDLEQKGNELSEAYKNASYAESVGLL